MKLPVDDPELFLSAYKHIWSFDLPSTTFQKPTQTFRIVTPFYNCSNYLPACIKSVKNQINQNFKMYLIDDYSEDNWQEKVYQFNDVCGKMNFIKNSERRFALKNISDAIDSIEDINNEDIIILLDGDDWLSCDAVLSHLEKTYNNKKCLVTYGNYRFYPHGGKGVEPSKYPQEVIDNNLYRKDIWRASHLRTFKYKVWKEINKKDLKYDNGEFLRFAYDQAIMLPLMEMVGGKAEFIPETLMVYNRNNPINVDKTQQTDQQISAAITRSRQSYEKKF
jgi:cellulose synthase/poly-beta-1,6-N-acetylglucosamine synthase-like glycosyltransferase